MLLVYNTKHKVYEVYNKFMYLESKLFLIKTNFCKPRLFHGLILILLFCLKSSFKGECISRI